jgi:hypothetical protein
MLEEPDLQDGKIAACLQDDYELRVVQVAFLPLGADLNTAVYRAVAEDATPYFVKLRRGVFDEIANEGGEDREQSLRYLTSNFLPNNTIEIAYTSDKTLRVG